MDTTTIKIIYDTVMCVGSSGSCTIMRQCNGLGDVVAFVILGLVVLMSVGCILFFKNPKKQLSSDRTMIQILGAMFYGFNKWLMALEAIAVVAFLLTNSGNVHHKSALMAICTLGYIIVYATVRVLTPLYNLSKKEGKSTWSQIILLTTFGVWIISAILILDISKENGAVNLVAVGVIGAVLSWVFQDTIKSVVAFLYLRAHDLIHIGDWIEVKSHGIDGVIKQITLTTVTIENWDTTTSSFPTYILHSTHFRNNQKMMDGRTHGRLMLKTFIIDTSWIRPLKEMDIEQIKATLAQENVPFLDQIPFERNVHKLNIELYREYLHHWLMRHEKVSHEPRLIVRWLNQASEGMPLQIYAFITDTYLAPFEWQQSQIIEHVIKSLYWFDLQLYQSPASYDVSNSNIHLTDNVATYKKDNHHDNNR